MASKELQDKVKAKLFEAWLPDKSGGLKGLINMAADAAVEALAEIAAENVMRAGMEAASDDVVACGSRNLELALTCEEESDDHDGLHHAENDQEGQFEWGDADVIICQSANNGFQCTEDEEHDGKHHSDGYEWVDDDAVDLGGFSGNTGEHHAKDAGVKNCQFTSNGFQCLGDEGHGEKHYSDGYVWDSAPPDPPVDQSRYICPQCGVTHQRISAVGARHAHLFYGGYPSISHLDHCPVLEDPKSECNCNAVPATAAQRAQDRREPSI